MKDTTKMFGDIREKPGYFFGNLIIKNGRKWNQDHR